MQGPLNVKDPAVAFDAKLKLPVGVETVPGDVSVTITLHGVAVFRVTGEVHDTVVLVVRTVTVIATLLLGPLEAWVESPP